MCHLNSANNLCAGPAVTTGDLPLPQEKQAVVYHGGCLYVVSEVKERFHMCDIHRINLNTFVWELLYVCKGNGECEPWFTWPYEIACDGENIFMFTMVGFCLEVFIFNMEKKKWTKRNIVGYPDLRFGDYPCGTIIHGIHHHDTKLQLYLCEDNTYAAYFDVTIWKIDLKMFQWTRISSTDANDVMCATISPDGSKHYIINYSDSDAATTTPEVFVTWLEIPKLSEICWEAVLHYLKVFDEEVLLRAGVPQRYVNSIK